MKGLKLLKRPLQFQRMWEEVFHFQFYNASREKVFHLTISQNFQVELTSILKFYMFIFSNWWVRFPLRLAIFTIQRAFLHIDMGVFYQKKQIFLCFLALSKKTSTAHPPSPRHQTTSTSPPSHYVSLGCFFTQKSCFIAQKMSPGRRNLGGGVSFPTPPPHRHFH